MNFHYPRYDELPEGLVFIDEVVELVNQVHASLPDSAKNGKERFTRSMASNYMKHGLTPPAVGKRYAREHVCLILFAATIKLITNAEATVALSRLVFSSGDYETTQNMVSEAFDKSMVAMDLRLNDLSMFSDDDLNLALAELLAGSVAAKVAAHTVADRM